MSGVPAQFRYKLCDILHCALFSWLRNKVTFFQIEHLLELQPGDVRLILRGLHSVLDIDSGSIFVHHASFRDFLRDQRRSSIFHVDLENRMNVARAVLKALSNEKNWRENVDDPLVRYVDALSESPF
jgi:hypothetical protein